MLDKEKHLKKYKRIATGLFLLMAAIYVSMLFAIRYDDSRWMHYVKAFSEAAMVGALADWFAVTALFRYPLGLKIPHTNLIESNKESIGANLGNFVTDNFLTPKTIRPYIEKLDVSNYIISWAEKPQSIHLITEEISHIILNVLNDISEESVIRFSHAQIDKNLSKIPFASFVSQGVQYAIENKEQDKLIDAVVPEIRNYIINNKQLIYKRVVEKQPILSLIGGKSVTNQLIDGLQSFLNEIEEDKNHAVRIELQNRILDWAEKIKIDSIWQDKFVTILSNYMNPETTEQYIVELWRHISESIQKDIHDEESKIYSHLHNWLSRFVVDFKDDESMQNKLNVWVQHSLYRMVLKNTKELGVLIERTVGDWDGEQLSEKLELEVGKDLQFIRVNGTLVGGLVGLIIYFLTTLIS